MAEMPQQAINVATIGHQSNIRRRQIQTATVNEENGGADGVCAAMRKLNEWYAKAAKAMRGINNVPYDNRVVYARLSVTVMSASQPHHRNR